MFLSGVLFVLFVAGCWLAWAVSRSARRARSWRAQGRRAVTPASAALDRHPSSQSRKQPGRSGPIGPDDDPEFLRMLGRLISGSSDQGE